MNYKLIFPTFRRRFHFVRDELQKIGTVNGTAINIGTGEGDYDHVIAQHVTELVSTDINEDDIAFAKFSNADVSNVRYEIQDATALTYADNSFDLAVCLEVIEHVDDSEKLLAECARVLKPGGMAIFTFPSLNFPFTYDPINWLLKPFGKHVPIGAYGYGHFKLIDPKKFVSWAESAGFEVVEEAFLTQHFTAIFELYYPSIIQSILKPNSGNTESGKKKRFQVRPSREDSVFGKITDVLMWIDRKLFGWSRVSFNGGYVLRKK
ncbi:MAG: methyltransferase domain-containing protein [Flavobacteriales bacterium]|nr:methyltransferase domain-containing protein [Flavobacteriales bacterium]